MEPDPEHHHEAPDSGADKAGGEQAAVDQAVGWIIEHYAGGNAR